MDNKREPKTGRTSWRTAAAMAAFLLMAGGAVIMGHDSKPEASVPRGQAGEVTVRLMDEKGLIAPPRKVPKVVRTEKEWKAVLTAEQYRVLRSQGTERPFCGGLLHNKKPGVYVCAGCRLPLFRSTAKFESGTGWPSFYETVAPENVTVHKDYSHGMVREEIVCTRCDGHLGHVFEDGPPPTGLRYCLNSAALEFVEVPAAGSGEPGKY